MQFPCIIVLWPFRRFLIFGIVDYRVRGRQQSRTCAAPAYGKVCRTRFSRRVYRDKTIRVSRIKNTYFDRTLGKPVRVAFGRRER